MIELDDSGDIDVLTYNLPSPIFVVVPLEPIWDPFILQRDATKPSQQLSGKETTMQAPVILLTLMLFSSNAYANCVTNERGRVVCSNGSEAGGYNSRTGTAWKSSRNENGVATTQTSRGGEAKTKNGKGVYKSPNGKDCYKTASSHGCN
jgi:hypothetical protein